MVRLLILPLLSLATLGACFPSNAIPLEDIQRLIQTAVKIELHNANASNTYTRIFNEFAALTPEQYKKLLGFRLNTESMPPPVRTFYAHDVNEDVPASMDWREKGAVSPVKNQGLTCGSCWAFATVGALEGQHAIKKGKLVQFSEQNLVDCDINDHGCNGGMMPTAYSFIQEFDGIDTEESYPYTAGPNDTCRFSASAVGESDSGYVAIHRGNEEALKVAVATIGPISVAIDAAAYSFQTYHGGVYYEPICFNAFEDLNHAVLVVGYGTDEKQGDYWIVKNSYGEKFGEKGYIRMARNRDNNCGIATFASYPIVE